MPKCPICRNSTVREFRPFCSKRCADVDLARWLGGVYAIPVADDSDEDGEKPVDPGSADDDVPDTRH